MLKDKHINTARKASFEIRKIAIRTSYYVFCCRNKQYFKPELMKY